MVWVAGAALFLASSLFRYWRFACLLDQSAVPVHDGATPAVGKVRVLASPFSTPVALGLRRQRIVVPVDFTTELVPRARLLAIRHEAACHDILANLAALVVLSLHWFSPIAHLTYRRFRADQELSCDRTIMRGLEPASRHLYGTTLLRYFARAGGGLPVAALSGRGELRLRVGALVVAENDRSSRRLTAIAAVALSIFALVAGWPPLVEPSPAALMAALPSASPPLLPCSGIGQSPNQTADFHRLPFDRLIRL